MSAEGCQPPMHRFGQGMRTCVCGEVKVPEAVSERERLSRERGRRKGFTDHGRMLGSIAAAEKRRQR